MRKKIIFILLILGFTVSIKTSVSASGMLQEQLDMLDFTEVSTVIDKTYYGADGVNFMELVQKAISGELDLSFKGILERALSLLFGEVTDNFDLIRNLIIVGILSALLKNLADSFNNKSVGELGFYVGYISIILIIFSSFKLACGITSEVIDNLSALIGASVPLVTSLVIMSGHVTTAYVLNPILLFLSNVITLLIKDIFLPGIILIASVQIVNYLTEKELLTKLTELIKNCLSWMLKGMTVIFMGVISLQRISAPILNNVLGKTAKSALNVVPVVGEVLSASVDTYFYWASAAKSGVIVAIFIGVVIAFALPVIKLTALIFIYKITASIIQPICEERIVKCVDAMGGFVSLLLGAMVTVITMFLFSLMIVLTL